MSREDDRGKVKCPNCKKEHVGIVGHYASCACGWTLKIAPLNSRSPREPAIITTQEDLDDCREGEFTDDLDRMKNTIEFLWGKARRCLELLEGPAPEISIPTVRTLLSQMYRFPKEDG